MKKNKMMRLASALLVLVLLTTCAISGTFAKYITTHNGADSARVAKWGVTATVQGSLFEDAYKDEPVEYDKDETDDAITVWAAEATNLVAPGTENTTGMTFVLTGTPEVDTKIEIVITDNNVEGEAEAVDVVLPMGTYTDYTKATLDEDGNPSYDETFTLDEDYHPLVFTLTSGTYSKSGTLAEIIAILEGLSGNYDANTDLSTILTGEDAEGEKTVGDGTYTLTWKWAYEAFFSNGLEGEEYEQTGTTDTPDTYLGNVGTGLIEASEVPEGVSTEVSFGIKITATQID